MSDRKYSAPLCNTCSISTVSTPGEVCEPCRKSKQEKLARFAAVEEFDLSDMLDFANALAKLSEDHREDVRCLINEDFGAIDHDSMIDVRRVMNEKGTSCDALDALLEEFFDWHASDQRERSQ